MFFRTLKTIRICKHHNKAARKSVSEIRKEVFIVRLQMYLGGADRPRYCSQGSASLSIRCFHGESEYSPENWGDGSLSVMKKR